jgi:four helix bundle protein
MKYTYAFEKLEVWQDARELVKSIYQLTTNFPRSELYGLVSQMRRAAISVVSNIAEGTGRGSLKDQARFYQIAFSSLIEVLNQLIISQDLKYIDETMQLNMRTQIEKVSNKLNALWQSRFRSGK